MATVFTRRLAEANANGGDQLLSVVPAGEIWIIRDVILAGLAATASYTLYLSTTGANPFVVQVVQPGSTWLHFDIRQAVNEGEALHFFTTEAVGQILVTGYRFLT